MAYLQIYNFFSKYQISLIRYEIVGQKPNPQNKMDETLKLPNEIIDMIVKKADQSSRVALTSVNKQWPFCVTPILYRYIEMFHDSYQDTHSRSLRGLPPSLEWAIDPSQ
jgi:hypothetical protein